MLEFLRLQNYGAVAVWGLNEETHQKVRISLEGTSFCRPRCCCPLRSFLLAADPRDEPGAAARRSAGQGGDAASFQTLPRVLANKAPAKLFMARADSRLL